MIFQSEIGVDALEDVKVVFEDKSLRKEEARARNLQVGEEEKLHQVDEGLEDDRSFPLAADLEVRQRSVNSLVVEKLKDCGME